MRFDSLLITHTCMTTPSLTIWSSTTCCLYEKMMICKYFIKKYNIYRVSNKENSILILFTSYTISEMFYGYSRTIIDANKWCLQKNLSVKRIQLLTFFSKMHLPSHLSHIFLNFPLICAVGTAFLCPLTVEHKHNHANVSFTFTLI